MSMLFRQEIKQKKSLIFFILALVLFTIGTIVQFNKSEKSTNNDFRVYYKTSERIKAKTWEKIYTRDDGAFPFRYVPYTVPAFSWMTYFTELEARKIWLFMQAFTFFIGFYYLYKSLILTDSPYPLLATSLSSLLTFRQYMDSLYSGQVAGFVFLSFCLGMYFYLRDKTIMDGAANSIASTFKIFPGLLLVHGLIKAPGINKKIKFFLSGILLFIIFNFLYFIWLKINGIGHLFTDFWYNWINIVVSTGEYFDGSTPKSQSMRAFILRTFGKNENSELVWKILTVFGISGLIIHWMTGTSKKPLHGAYSYALGVMAFLIFMPESLPYQLMNIAIPFAVFMSDSKIKKEKMYWPTLTAFILFISFASTDFIGRALSDEIQSHSAVFFTVCLLSYMMIKESRSKDQVVST